MDRARCVRELGQFFAITLCATVALHGSLVAFGLEFSLSPSSPSLALYLAGLATPALAAVWLSGRSGWRSFLGSVFRPSGSPALYAAALFAQPIILAVALLFCRATGETALPRISVAQGFGLLALGQIWVVFGEEIGWRGFALPRLLQLGSARAATAVLAVVWGFWHAPMFFVSGSLQSREPVWVFAAAICAWSSIHTALYLRARPSILPNLTFHAAANLSLNLVVVPDSARAALAGAYAVAALLTWISLGSGKRGRAAFQATLYRKSAT